LPPPLRSAPLVDLTAARERALGDLRAVAALVEKPRYGNRLSLGNEPPNGTSQTIVAVVCLPAPTFERSPAGAAEPLNTADLTPSIAATAAEGVTAA